MNLNQLILKVYQRKKFIIYDLRNIYSSEKIKNQGLKYFSVGVKTLI